MQNKTQINTALLVVIIILLGVVIWILINKDNSQNDKTISNSNNSLIPKDDLTTINVSESDSENAKNQPGSVKSVVSVSGGWNLSVDYLSYNDNWEPGNDSTGGFFVNLNPKLRTLFLPNNSDNIVFKCGTDTRPTIPYLNTLAFINELNRYLVSGGYTTYYFDVKNGTITGIYEQCLP